MIVDELIDIELDLLSEADRWAKRAKRTKDVLDVGKAEGLLTAARIISIIREKKNDL